MPAGGVIPPDGRPPQAKGVGKDAKRHDLEAPATPGLHGSDLQYGDVSELEQGQAVAPIAKQMNASGRTTPVSPQGGGGPRSILGGSGLQPPNPVEFAAQRFGGTLEQPMSGRRPSTAGWSQLYHRLQGGRMSGALRAAMIEQMSKALASPQIPDLVEVDLFEADAGGVMEDSFLYE